MVLQYNRRTPKISIGLLLFKISSAHTMRPRIVLVDPLDLRTNPGSSVPSKKRRNIKNDIERYGGYFFLPSFFLHLGSTDTQLTLVISSVVQALVIDLSSHQSVFISVSFSCVLFYKDLELLIWTRATFGIWHHNLAS